MPAKKTSSSVQVLLLTQKAEVKEVLLSTSSDGKTTLAAIQALLKKKEVPELIGSYKYKSQWLFLFGYMTGKAGAENKHEFPPPHDTTICFGDIVLLCSKDSKSWDSPVSFKMGDYENFYTRAFGGFENLQSDDEQEDTAADADAADADVEAEADVDAEVDADVDADADTEAEVEEGEEEVVEDVEAEVEATIPLRVVKKKRRTAVAAIAPGAAEVYASYLHVSSEDELVQESFDTAYNESDVHPKRRKVLVSLRSLFKDMLTDVECAELERCIYNGTLRNAGQRHIGKSWAHTPFIEMYNMFAKHISANFHPSTYVENTELYARYKSGEITFKDISEMDTYQLFEERWKESFLQQQVREKRQLEGNKSMATDQFLCMRCHKRECTYYEMQTRSADEPMTIFITCLNCGKHWRQ